MIQVYLIINSLLYLVLALWCLLKPNVTANFLGYSFINTSGKVEYLTIYAGLELGFSVFLAIAAFYPNIRFSGLLFCVCIYIGAMLLRTVSALHYGNVLKVTYLIGGLEYVLGILGVVLLVYEKK